MAKLTDHVKNFSAFNFQNWAETMTQQFSIGKRGNYATWNYHLYFAHFGTKM